MRWLATVAALLGCAPASGGQAPRATRTPYVPETLAGTPASCSKALVADLKGKRWDPARVEAVRTRAKARTIRVLGPTAAATMDYSPDRLTVQLDARSRVVSIECG